MRTRQLEFLFDDEPEIPVPLIYLACRLTNISTDQMKLLDSWCTHITQAVAEASEESSMQWKVRIHAPLKWSAPWNSDLPPEKIYEKNSSTIADCSAVIILATDGGGFGVGQEFAWAVALRLPILMLHPQDVPLSRQAQGTPADVEIVNFKNADELVDLVRTFLKKNRSVIEDWNRRSESLAFSLLPLREALSAMWEELDDGGKSRVESESRVHKSRVKNLLEQESVLAGASISELLSLSGALGLNIAEFIGTSSKQDLSERQRASLGSAADEYEWSGPEVLRLEMRARLELARGGTRRLSLVTPADWLTFKEQVSGRG